MSVPRERCGFELGPDHVVESGAVDDEGESYLRGLTPEQWASYSRGSCCWRPVWRDTGRCLWHAEVEHKPVDDLVAARADESDPVVLDGASLPSLAAADRLSFRGCRLVGATLAGADLTRADLAVADLQFADLSGVDAPGVALSEAVLGNVNLSDARLDGADLEGAALGFGDLPGAVLRDADLSGTDLRRADLSGADLTGADLSGADLSGVSLLDEVSSGEVSRWGYPGASLQGATLAEATLRDADLSGVSFPDVGMWATAVVTHDGDWDLDAADPDRWDLSGADLRDADLRDADLSGADLSGAEFERGNTWDLVEAVGGDDLHSGDFSDLWTLSGANLRNADLTDADLADADLSGGTSGRHAGADLRGATLTEATLRDADLSGWNPAQPSGADLRDADLGRADLGGATLRAVDGKRADLSGADLGDVDALAADFGNADLSGADLRWANLREVNLLETDLDGVRLNRGTTVADLERGADRFERFVKFEARNQVPSVWFYLEELVADLRRLDRFGVRVDVEGLVGRLFMWVRLSAAVQESLARVYHALGEAAMENGLIGDARTYRIRERRARRKEALGSGDVLAWGGSLASWLVTGYGISITRIVTTILVVILACAVAYWTLGVDGGETIPAALDYSVATFTGVGAPGGPPSTHPARALVVVEAFAGVLFSVLLGYVLGTRESP